MELLKRMRSYDAGLALIPNNLLYEVASPTAKTMEYYAMGLPALMSPLAEHTRFFNENYRLFLPAGQDIDYGDRRTTMPDPARGTSADGGGRPEKSHR